MRTDTELVARLADADARLFEGVTRRSLAPSRARATGIDGIVAALGREGVPMGLLEPLGDGLVAIAGAMLDAFPDNLFWDLDFLAASLAREAMRSGDARAHLTRAVRTACVVQHPFGCKTPIRFRYVHDFSYGFDWSKWVLADSAARAHVGPFDMAFLERMKRRGEELLGLIAEDDAKYGRLAGETARNPFPFSREIEDEERLMRDLAARRALPVEAWRFDATPEWDRPYYRLREERANALGLAAPG